MALTVVTDRRMKTYHDLLMDKIKADFDALINNADIDFDTLGEIASWIKDIIDPSTGEVTRMGAENRIEALEEKVEDGFDEIKESYIRALFAGYKVDLLADTPYNTDEMKALIDETGVDIAYKKVTGAPGEEVITMVGYAVEAATLAKDEGNLTVTIPSGSTYYVLTLLDPSDPDSGYEPSTSDTLSADETITIANIYSLANTLTLTNYGG